MFRHLRLIGALALSLAGSATAQSPAHIQGPPSTTSIGTVAYSPVLKAPPDEATVGGQASPLTASTSSPLQVSPAPSSPEPSNYYKSWIYNEESGNDPTRYNTEGCLGLGQACPASKLLIVCPTMDYACEDAWFTNYMEQRYTTWYNAYIWHINHGWW